MFLLSSRALNLLLTNTSPCFAIRFTLEVVVKGDEAESGVLSANLIAHIVSHFFLSIAVGEVDAADLGLRS